MGDTLSIKVYQAVAAALQLNPGRSVILSDTGNFPSDLYMVQGLAQSLERKVELRLVEPSEVADALDDSVAALMLTEVDYRTGRLHDMKSLTSRAHERGVSPSGTWHTRREPFPWTCRAATPISPLAAPTSTSTEGPAHQRSST
jgi:kynureninase